jgi:signal transduction histidine kinase
MEQDKNFLMNIDLIVLTTSSLAIALLGFIVLLRNPRQSNNRRFGALSVSIIAWTIFNYLADNASAHNLLFTRLTILSGVLSIFSVLYFIRNFPSESALDKNLLIKSHSLLSIIMVPVSFLPGFISSVAKHSDGVSVNTASLYPFFILYVALSFGCLFYIIRRQSSFARTAIQKEQVHIISWGISLYAVFAIFSNVILPALIDNWSSSRFGPAFTLIFIALIAYAIAKSRLFDIRPIIARSAAYILLLASLSGIFAVSLFTLTTIFFNNQPISSNVKIVYILVALVAAFFLQPLKRFFDKITNKVFFRDYYEPQEVLDEISSFLVGTVDIRLIERHSSHILMNSLKPSSIDYLLLAEEESQKSELLKLLLNQRRDTVIFDELNQDSHNALRNSMREDNIAAAARLKTSHKDLGFIVLGFKQSGGVYSEADKKLLGIIADEIAIGLQNAIRFEEIQRFNITLQEKVDEATRKLRHANVRLKELDATKDEFISMASHQLRTPLTTIKGYLSMILDGDVGKVKAEEKEMVQHAFDSAQRMVYLIADLLNVSRLQSGKFVIDNKPTYLPEVVEGEVQQLKEQAANRKIKMSYTAPKEFPTLNLDETKMRQVIMNFLDNALYYTPANGEVTVGLAVSNDTASFTVSDTGVGVPKDIQHHLFTKFYRADNARKMRPDGTGLGLYMAKKVIVAQNGAIIFKSIEGKGSTFGFSFPLSAVAVKKN